MPGLTPDQVRLGAEDGKARTVLVKSEASWVSESNVRLLALEVLRLWEERAKMLEAMEQPLDTGGDIEAVVGPLYATIDSLESTLNAAKDLVDKWRREAVSQCLMCCETSQQKADELSDVLSEQEHGG